MTALIVARFDVKDAEKMNAYATAAGPAVLAYGGEFVAIGEKVTTLVGEKRVAVHCDCALSGCRIGQKLVCLAGIHRLQAAPRRSCGDAIHPLRNRVTTPGKGDRDGRRRPFHRRPSFCRRALCPTGSAADVKTLAGVVNTGAALTF